MRWILRAVLVGLILLVVVGGIVYRDPIGVLGQKTRFDLWRAGVRQHYVQVGAYNIHYYEATAGGAADGGTPLVLVHGWGADATAWAPLIPKLAARGFHVYVPDLLGYGGSPKPDVDYSISLEEQVVSGFMRQLRLTHANVGGWSMGGWIAAELALDEPGKVDRLVLYDAAGVLYTPAYSLQLFFPTDREGVQALFDHLAPEPKPIPGFLADAALRQFASNDRTIRRGMLQMTSGRELLDKRLSAMKPPMLILWGAKDRLIPVESGERMHALVPGSNLEVVKGCGHLMPAECSVAAASATVEFLRSEPAMRGETKTLAQTH